MNRSTAPISLPGLDLVRAMAMADQIADYESQAAGLPPGPERELLLAKAASKRYEQQLVFGSYGLSYLIH